MIRFLKIERTNNKNFLSSTHLLYKNFLLMILPLAVGSLSNLILVNIDSVICGNAIDSSSIAAINLLLPFILFIGSFGILIFTGFVTLFTKNRSNLDFKSQNSLKITTTILAAVSALLTIILEYCFLRFILPTYGVSTDMQDLTRQYGIGLSISLGIGIFCTQGVYIFSAYSLPRKTMILSIVEAVSNIIFGYILVVVLHLGVFGAGLSSSIACSVRLILTIVFTKKYTDFLSFRGGTFSWYHTKQIAFIGIARVSGNLINSLISKIILDLIIFTFGEEYIVCRSVILFVSSINFIFANAVCQAMYPYIGILKDVNIERALVIFFKRVAFTIFFISFVFMLILLIFPNLAYLVYGMDNVSVEYCNTLRMFSISLPFSASNVLFIVYYTYYEKYIRAMVLNVLQNLVFTLLFACLFSRYIPQFFWLSEALSAILIFSFNQAALYNIIKKSNVHKYKISKLFAMKSSHITKFPEYIEKICNDNNLTNAQSVRLRICSECLANYLFEATQTKDIEVEIMLLVDKDARIVLLDNGSSLFVKSKTTSNNSDNWIDNINIDYYECLKFVKDLSSDFEYNRINELNYLNITINIFSRVKVEYAKVIDLINQFI